MKPLIALVACTLATSSAAAEPQVLHLKPLRERLRTIEVVINGQEGQFLVDTGGGITTISPQFAEKIGCKPWGRISGHRMFGDRLDMQRCDGMAIQAGNVTFAPTTLAVFDSAPLLQPGATPPDGALALDVLEDRSITLEFAANRITIETPESLARRIEGATELPLRVTREPFGSDIYAGVDTPKGRLWMIMDSGAGGVSLVAKDMAALFGLDPDNTEPQVLKFDLAPGVLVDSPAITVDMILDGNLGMPFLRHYAVTLDLKAQRMWIKPAT